MSHRDMHPAIAQIVGQLEQHPVLDGLGTALSRSDLTTLMLEVAQRRAASLTPANVLAQYQHDRFTRRAVVDPLKLHEMQLVALRTVAPVFDPVENSPLAPLGTHSVVAGVHQDRVVTTMRSTEVAADPTNSLALEAAVRRRDLLACDARSASAVHLASVDRVVRAQRFDGPLSFAHFSLLGLVSAGRDTGNRTFETTALEQHVRTLAGVADRLGWSQVIVELTDFDGGYPGVVDSVREAVAGETIAVEQSPHRESGRGYYPHLCFRLSVIVDGDAVEVADGGFVDWTQALVGSRKERLMISGLSIERLAAIDATR